MRALALFTSLAAFAFTFAQHNITVSDTDPSIHYEGNAGDASICKTDGTILSGQPGCYLVFPNCTSSAAMGQGGSGAASFQFRGTAIYINSLLDDLSPLYTVTLDGQSTDVDGVRNSKPFACYPLYSMTGLDPNADHEVRLSVKGPSPSRNQTIPGSEEAFNFSLINFIYTAVDATANPSSSISASAPSNTSDSEHTTANSSKPSNDGAEVSRFSSWSVLGTVLALGGLVII